MAIQDLTLNFDDKTISNTFIKGKQQVLQAVVLALQCWAGDWFLDGEIGIAYNLRLDNKSLLLADIQEVILGVEGVQSLKNLKIEVGYQGPKKTQKVFYITGDITTEDEQQVFLNGLVNIVGS